MRLNSENACNRNAAGFVPRLVDKFAAPSQCAGRERQPCIVLMDERVASASLVRSLIESVRQGDKAALKRLYELEARRLYGIALRILRRPDLAADAVQDTFVQVWQKAAAYSPERGDPGAWLTGIVRYRAIDIVRKYRREVLSDDPRLGDGPDDPSIIDRLDAQLAQGALRRCLGELEDRQRLCVVLAFVDGLSHAEIATRLTAPLGSVKSWVRRGLISLRSCLET